MGGVEAALVFVLRTGISHGVHWPVTLMATLAALFLALGVLEQYVAILEQRGVEGISFLFCGIDALGDVASIISVCFEPRLEVVGLVAYSVELSLWLGIFAFGGRYKLFPRLKQAIEQMRSNRRNEDETEAPSGNGNNVAMHGTLASSTSVFRTASAEHEMRSRAPVVLAANG